MMRIAVILALLAAPAAAIADVTTDVTSDAAPAADPIPDPSDTFDAARTAWASGLYALAVVVVLLALARGAYAAAERWPESKVVSVLRLRHPRVRAAIVGSVSVLAALAVELGNTGAINWQVVVGAAAAAVALFLRPEPKGKPATIPAPHPAPGTQPAVRL